MLRARPPLLHFRVSPTHPASPPDPPESLGAFIRGRFRRNWHFIWLWRWSVPPPKQGKSAPGTRLDTFYQTAYFFYFFCFFSPLLLYFSVGCLWHSHSKNPVRLYPKLQNQPIGLRKIFIDYLFFQADQSDCTKSVSIFNRFASSEERWNQNVSCQICRAWVFPLVV